MLFTESRFIFALCACESRFLGPGAETTMLAFGTVFCSLCVFVDILKSRVLLPLYVVFGFLAIIFLPLDHAEFTFTYSSGCLGSLSLFVCSHVFRTWTKCPLSSATQSVPFNRD
jgi:hypothetical protein